MQYRATLVAVKIKWVTGNTKIDRKDSSLGILQTNNL